MFYEELNVSNKNINKKLTKSITSNKFKTVAPDSIKNISEWV